MSGECVPFGTWDDTLAGWKGRGWSICWKTPDTVLYSTYIRKYFVLLCQRFSVGEEVCLVFPTVLPIKVLNFFLRLDLLARSIFVLF